MPASLMPCAKRWTALRRPLAPRGLRPGTCCGVSYTCVAGSGPSCGSWPKRAPSAGLDAYQRLSSGGARAGAGKHPAEAGRLYARLVQQAPFAENGLVAAAAFHTNQGDFPAAYDVLLRGVEYNPESVPLLKAYVLAAVPVGLMGYAEAPLYRLGTLLSAADYGTFRKEYDAALAARKASWN